MVAQAGRRVRSRGRECIFRGNSWLSGSEEKRRDCSTLMIRETHGQTASSEKGLSEKESMEMVLEWSIFVQISRKDQP